MEALEVATRLSSARFHQQRAANTGQEPLAPTPRQQQSFLCEYNRVYDTVMGPHYLTTSKSAAVAKDIGMPPMTFHQLMAAERKTDGTILPSHSRDQQPTGTPSSEDQSRIIDKPYTFPRAQPPPPHTGGNSE